MKKLLTLSFCLLCVITLVACDSIFKEEHIHTYEYICNEDTHQKVYTCGCPSPDIAEEHSNFDADLYCDICGYFLDSNRVSTYLPAEEEWLNAVTEEDIVKIRTVRHGTLLGTGRLKEVLTVTDPDDIYKILASFRALEITPLWTGDDILWKGYEINDNYYEAQFIFASGEMKKIIINGDFLYKQYSIGTLPLLNDYESATLAFCFNTQAETARVIEYTNGAAEVLHTVCHIPMDELQFLFVLSNTTNEDDYPIVLFNENTIPYPYDVRTEIGTLDFHSNDLFTVSGEGDLHYRLVGKNLDQLIAEYAPQAE